MNHPSRIVVVGASAGGVEALQMLVGRLPADFPAAMLIAMHIPPQVPSLLAAILDRRGPLPALDAIDGQPIRAGHIYVGVPNRHLLVDGEIMRLARGPKENRFRPSIDALFRSAAYTNGPCCCGRPQSWREQETARRKRSQSRIARELVTTRAAPYARYCTIHLLSAGDVNRQEQASHSG